MKLNFKTVLPILLLFALFTLLTGCFITPSDEHPGYTPGTINGIIAAPCCSTSADPVTEPSCVYSEYWYWCPGCYDCEGDWSLQDGVEVVLTYELDEIATTTTNEDGEYSFTNVPPGKNYVITAYCPDYDDDRPLVKDVALEVLAGKTYDAKITDCVSTALGLVVDYLVENTTVLGPEEIVLDGVLADRPNFYSFPDFKKLVDRICEISAGCVNLFEDEKVPDYLCKAAEEVGQVVIPDLNLGCTPGYTPGEGEGEEEVYYTLTLLSDPVEGAASLTGAGTYPEGTLDVAVNTSANPCYTFLNWTVDLGNPAWVTGNLNAEPLQVDMYGNVTLTAHFSCPPLSSVGINIVGPTRSRSALPSTLELCMDECATINSVTIKYDCGGNPSDLVITDLTDSRLVWNYDDTKISFNKTTGAVCLVGGYETGTAGKYTIGVTYTDPCGVPVSGSVEITFKDCRCQPPTANAGTDQKFEVCPGKDALVDFVGSGTGTEPLSYAWDLNNDGEFDDSTLQNPQDVSFGATGSPHTVTLKVTNGCGEATDEVIITVTESADLAVDAGGPYTKTVCPKTDATIDFNGTASGTGSLTYAWDFGDGGTSNLEDPSHTYIHPFSSPYTVTLTVTDSCGSKSDKTTVTITESALPTADAGADQCIQLTCASEVEVDFDGSGSSGVDLVYDWDFGDGKSALDAGAKPSHTYEAGTYTVTLTVTDSCGNSDTDTMNLTIHSACGNLPSQLTVSESYTLTDYYLKVKFSDGSGDIVSGTWYNGWCAHMNLVGLPRAGDVLNAYCTLELDTYWPKINWIINNRSGYSRMEVQNAIWHYIHGIDVSGNAKELVEAADLHGDFCPKIGKKYVVLLTFGTIDSYGNLYKCDHDQNIMIEVTRVDHCLLD